MAEPRLRCDRWLSATPARLETFSAPRALSRSRRAARAIPASRRSGKGFFWLILLALAAGAAFFVFRNPAILQKLPFFQTAQQAPADTAPPSDSGSKPATGGATEAPKTPAPEKSEKSVPEPPSNPTGPAK